VDSRSSGGRVRTLPAAGAAISEASIDVRTGSRPKLETANENGPPPEGLRVEASQRVRSLPPFDPTVARPSRKPLPRVVRPTPKPILASECLRDDAAPIEPNDRGTRLWTAGLGLAIVGCAGTMLARSVSMGADGNALRVAAAAGLTGLLIAILGLASKKYALRGALVLATILGGTCALLVGHDGFGMVLVRWLLLAPLPAALFLRVSYRSDKTVRAMLGASIVAFLVVASFAAGTFVFSPGASLVARIVAGAMALVSGLSLLGFMGEETTAGCTAWGTLAILLGAASFVLEAFYRAGAPSWLVMATVAFALPIAVIGVFQIVAAIIGPRLRVLTSSRSSLPVPQPEEPDEGMLPHDD
jgi:hypothetical protein